MRFRLLKAISESQGHPNLLFSQVGKVKKLQINGKALVREYDYRFAHFSVLHIEGGVSTG